jgi:hypothetical protein
MKPERKSLLDLAGDVAVALVVVLLVVGLLEAAAVHRIIYGGSYREQLDALASLGR